MADYPALFAALRVDTSPAWWSSVTLHRAPHKRFLLLSVLDLVEQGVIRANLIPFDDRLVDGFDRYWSAVFGAEPPGNPVLPFFHLGSEPFWHLVPVPGMGPALAGSGQIRSARRLREVVVGARVDEALFACLLRDDQRRDLRMELIRRAVVPSLWDRLAEIALGVADAFRYERRLLAVVGRRFVLAEDNAGAEYTVESRSSAFRRIVVTAYDHACALCGVRILTPEGRSAVAAAHVVPWSVSHNDDPRNGLALYGLHHWVFDQGLATIREGGRVGVSKLVGTETGTVPLRELNGRPILFPADPSLRPAEEALTWHRTHVYRSS